MATAPDYDFDLEDRDYRNRLLPREAYRGPAVASADPESTTTTSSYTVLTRRSWSMNGSVCAWNSSARSRTSRSRT